MAQQFLWDRHLLCYYAKVANVITVSYVTLGALGGKGGVAVMSHPGGSSLDTFWKLGIS